MIRLRSDCRHETSRQSPIWGYGAVMTSPDPIPHAIPRRRPYRIADAVDTALRRNLPNPVIVEVRGSPCQPHTAPRAMPAGSSMERA